VTLKHVKTQFNILSISHSVSVTLHTDNTINISLYNPVSYNVSYNQVYITGSTHVTTMDTPLASFLSAGSPGYDPRTFVIQAT
jgi:hypothetical protein